MRSWIAGSTALVLVLVACGDPGTTTPDIARLDRCRPPTALTTMMGGESLPPTTMHGALRHAIARIRTTFGAGVEQEALREAVLHLDADLTASRFDEACRALTDAFGSLTELPDVPATLPDRDSIRLILALTAQSLAARQAK
jgi:hypothetical protein